MKPFKTMLKQTCMYLFSTSPPCCCCSLPSWNRNFRPVVSQKSRSTECSHVKIAPLGGKPHSWQLLGVRAKTEVTKLLSITETLTE